MTFWYWGDLEGLEPETLHSSFPNSAFSCKITFHLISIPLKFKSQKQKRESNKKKKMENGNGNINLSIPTVLIRRSMMSAMTATPIVVFRVVILLPGHHLRSLATFSGSRVIKKKIDGAVLLLLTCAQVDLDCSSRSCGPGCSSLLLLLLLLLLSSWPSATSIKPLIRPSIFYVQRREK